MRAPDLAMRRGRSADASRFALVLSLVVVLVGLVGLLAGVVAAAAQEPGGSGPTPRGERRLAIDLTTPADDDFDAAFEVARRAGMEGTSLSLAWDDLEPSPGVYDNPFPAVADAYYSAAGTALHLVIAPVDTNNRRLPADLEGRAWDDPEVIERFRSLLDWVLGQMPDVELAAIALGNEVDAGLAGEEWERYRTFFAAAADHARSLRPGVPVGATATWAGRTGPEAAELAALDALSDVVLVTYYPLTGGFQVRDPSEVAGDVARLVDAADRPVVFLEAGVPSGALCASSEDLQARFVGAMFRAWDAHAERVPEVSFTWLHDIPEAAVQEFAGYYGIGAPAFAEYLRTLGLRRRPGDGADKVAFRELRANAAARGWAVEGPTVPITPGDLVAVATGPTTVELTWTDHAVDETELVVEVAPGADGEGAGGFDEAVVLAPDTSATTVSGLAPGVAHVFRVRARNAAGPSAWSAPVRVVTPEDEEPACPAGFVGDPAFPGFCFRVVVTPPGAEPFEATRVDTCLAETVCFAGALAGRTEVFVRLIGPRPNGYLWPTLVRLTPSRLDVTIARPASGDETTYRLEAAGPGGERLDGLVDRFGFLPLPPS